MGVDDGVVKTELLEEDVGRGERVELWDGGGEGVSK